MSSERSLASVAWASHDVEIRSMFSSTALRFPWLATLIVALLVCALFLAACENASVAAPPPTTITVVGATGMRQRAA